MADGCTHHWTLSSSSFSSPARCTLCGAERTFTGGESETRHWSQSRTIRPPRRETASRRDPESPVGL
jgi:hypothetical protein